MKTLKEKMESMVSAILEGLLSKELLPDVKYDITEGRKTIVVEIEAPKPPVGRLIGKHGKTAQAITRLLVAIAATHGKRCSVNIVEGDQVELEVPLSKLGAKTEDKS